MFFVKNMNFTVPFYTFFVKNVHITSATSTDMLLS